MLTEATGVYREVRVLGASDRSESYSGQVAAGLTRIFGDYEGSFERFVVHASFNVGRRALDGVALALGGDNREIAVLKFNMPSSFFGWDLDANSMVPYTGSVVELSNEEALVWFSGVDPNRPKAMTTDRGIHVRFLQRNQSLPSPERRRLLGQAFGMARGNWRGFNARSLPVSVAYAQMVAKFLRGFAESGLDMPPTLPDVPWFL